MIHSLNNSDNIGPKSKSAKNKKRTINENHARELLELHTVSPASGYTQEDITQLAYVSTGYLAWLSKSTKDTMPVEFDKDYHQPGKKNGKKRFSKCY